MKVLKDMGDAILSRAKNIGEKVNEKIDNKSKDNNKNGSKRDKNVLNIFADKLDVNGDGKVDLKDFVLMAVKVPGVNINRREFLKKELGKKNNEKKIAIALEQNPKLAKIDDATIEYIADDVIEAERKKVVAISAALGVSGAVAITLPADVAQYFAFMLRVAQKLMYLYGYPELNVDKNIDEDTVNIMTIALGTMMGVQGADAALRSLSGSIVKTISAGIKVSTKGVPQFIGSLVGVGLGKLGFGVVGLSLPIIGGAISGGLTHVTFTSACDRLRKELRNGPLNDEKEYEVD
ncbi:MAG: hypothetical protein IJP71_00455 [Lachnospiraceae bacterium]|nr:hypothetical protein [Lachnospiraceae bacterium]